MLLEKIREEKPHVICFQEVSNVIRDFLQIIVYRKDSMDLFGLEHLKRVSVICKKYDFEPMMWSDMFFRLGTPSGDYYDMKAKLQDNISEMIPEGISLVYGDHYNYSEKIYQVMIREHKKRNAPLFLRAGSVRGARLQLQADL